MPAHGWLYEHDRSARSSLRLWTSGTANQGDGPSATFVKQYIPVHEAQLKLHEAAVCCTGTYDKVMFVDLDIVVVGPLSDILALSTRSTELIAPAEHAQLR